MSSYVDLIVTATLDEFQALRSGDAIAFQELAPGIALQVVIRVVFGVDDPDLRKEYAWVMT
jgi:cytochrome P450